MITGSTAWFALSTAFAVVLLIITYRQGPTRGLGVAMVLAFAVPMWLTEEFLGQPFGLRTITAIVALLAYCLHPQGQIRSPLTLLDFCVAGVFAVHVWSDTLADGFSAMTAVRAYGEWVLPYIAGRFAVKTVGDLHALRRWLLPVLLVLAATSVVESLFAVNVWETVFGEPTDYERERNGVRFGLKRACGIGEHPIFMAMLLLLMLPWTTMRSVWSDDVDGEQESNPAARFAATLLLIAGVAAGVSRGPLAGLLVVGAVVLMLRSRQALIAILCLSAAIGTGIAAFPDASLQFLEQFGGNHERLVEVDDELRTVTGTRQRLMIYQAYRDPMLHAGLTGYGSAATSQFPPNVPYLEASRDTVEKLRLVDNAYVLTILRFGWLGLLSFLLLFLTAIGTAISLRADERIQSWCSVLAGCLIACLAVFFTVWMSYDFGCFLLWSIGLLAGLSAARQKTASDQAATRENDR